MKKLTNLFKVIELTRHVPQYGYVPSGIGRSELSNIAEHQYLVTFIAWQLALYLESKGAKIDVRKVIEISLVHDVGELLGGDISFYYGRSNPAARKAAKAFEKENINHLSNFFENPKHFLDLHAIEQGEIVCDEAIVEKFGDLLEAVHFKSMLNVMYKNDLKEVNSDLLKMLNKAKDPVVKKELTSFLKLWSKNVSSGNIIEIITGLKK